MQPKPKNSSAGAKPKGIFLQPFGMRSPGGGPRILRALAEDCPYDIVSIVTSATAAPACEYQEIHMPYRPSFGRIERSRLAWLPTVFDSQWKASFRKRLRKQIEDTGPSFVHVIPHDTLDFSVAHELCRELRIPCVVSVHDHPEYCFQRSRSRSQQLRGFAKLWLEASARTVISTQLGESLNSTFGTRDWSIVTDGAHIAERTAWTPKDSCLKIYFMGLVHHSYRPNLRAVCRAIEAVRAGSNEVNIQFRLRCGSLPADIIQSFPWLEVLPYADESTVESDIKDSDLLYLPLPFTPEHAMFTQYSLSTKMVSYLPSARPILFHGPTQSAAGQLLEEHQAAISSNSLDSHDLVDTMTALVRDKHQLKSIVANAGNLAQTRFSLREIRQRFWSSVAEAIVQSPPERQAG